MEDPIEVFEQALNLEWPWYVDEVTFDAGNRILLIHLDFETGGVFTCGTCGDPDCKAYDTAPKQWRHLDFFNCQTYLHGPSPRVICPSCGVRQAELPWARRRQRLTLSFERMVVSMAREMPVRAVSRLLGEQDTRIGRIVRHYAGHHGHPHSLPHP